VGVHIKRQRLSLADQIPIYFRQCCLWNRQTMKSINISPQCSHTGNSHSRLLTTGLGQVNYWYICLHSLSCLSLFMLYGRIIGQLKANSWICQLAGAVGSHYILLESKWTFCKIYFLVFCYYACFAPLPVLVCYTWITPVFSAAYNGLLQLPQTDSPRNWLVRDLAYTQIDGTGSRSSKAGKEAISLSQYSKLCSQ